MNNERMNDVQFKGELQTCPSCGRDVLINHDAMTTFHINPPCEWFDRLMNTEAKIEMGCVVKLSSGASN